MVTFAYNGNILVMKNPELGNKNDLEFTRLSRSTTGGDLIIFRDEEWPAIEKMTLTFDFCNQNLVGQIRRFIKSTLGKEFTYTDHNGISWNALLTNPNTAIAQAGINTYTVGIELEVKAP